MPLGAFTTRDPVTAPVESRSVPPSVSLPSIVAGPGRTGSVDLAQPTTATTSPATRQQSGVRRMAAPFTRRFRRGDPIPPCRFVESPQGVPGLTRRGCPSAPGTAPSFGRPIGAPDVEPPGPRGDPGDPSGDSGCDL